MHLNDTVTHNTNFFAHRKITYDNTKIKIKNLKFKDLAEKQILPNPAWKEWLPSN